MSRIQLSTLTTLVAFSLFPLAGCGGGVTCDVPPDEQLPVTVTPSELIAGEETTVLVSFDEPVFSGGGFQVLETDVDIHHPTEPEFVGSFHDSVFRMDQGEPPFVDGVILSGEVIDDRTIELIIEFSADAEPEQFPVVARASNGGVECHTQVLGEAALEVVTGS